MALNFEDTQIAFQNRTNKELKLAHFLFLSLSSPIITKVGMTLAKYTVKWNLPFQGIIKKTIFQQFCGGETLLETAQIATKLNQFNVDVALDYGVEGKESEHEFDHALSEFMKAIEYASQQENIPFIPLKVTGFARFALLEKLHAQLPLSEKEQKESERIEDRINQICKASSEKGLMVLIDAEDSWIQGPVNDLATKMMERYNKERVVVFNTYQLYRHEHLPDLKKAHQKAVAENYLLGAKLVRGAYMEKERERAKEKNYPSPINATKADTDHDYNAAIEYCLQNNKEIAVFIGTHNEDSNYFAVNKMAELQIDKANNHVFFSQLYGMSDNITFNLAAAGFNASKYLPYGPVKDVVPYLLRRADENSSVKGQTNRELSLIKKEMKRRSL